MKGKLRGIDVVEIKRLLMKGEFTNKEIGEMFGVAPNMISRIKTGARWGHIQIDENGSHIKNEILPENFKIEIDEIEEKKIVIADDETIQYRKAFIKGYFTKKSKDHYEPASKKSKRFIGGIWNNRKWLFGNEWDDFISEIMLITTNAVMAYNPIDINFDWVKVNDETSKEYATINSYINKAIKARLQDYANELNNNYLEQKENVKEWKKVDIGSVDAVVENDGAETAIIDTLSDEHNYFAMKSDYVGSPFLNWFIDNHEDLLTDEQIRFLNIYKYFVHCDSSYVAPYSQIKNKPFTENQIRHHIRRIRERVESAWEQVEKMGLHEMGFDKEIDFWQGFIKLVEIEDERLHQQNELLSNWIKKHQDNRFVEDILFDFEADDILEIRLNKVIPSSVLYKIVNDIHERIIFLKSMTE